MLKQILKSYQIKFKLVFVSSCHSEFVGEIFYNKGVGANHVISIKNEETIADETSIIFAKSLYNALFMNPDFTICKAYKVAIQQVKIQGWKGEDLKYVFMKDHEDHECEVFDTELRDGLPVNLGINNI